MVDCEGPMANQVHLDILAKGVEHWNAWRVAHPHIVPDLSEASFRGIGAYFTNLKGADLSGARLTHARFEAVVLDDADFAHSEMIETNFSQALLKGASFSHGRLIRADLSDAVLIQAELQKADLTGANLTGADLLRADLKEVNLTAACIARARLASSDWSGAILNATILADVDLREVLGLNRVVHEGPSSISVDTLRRSGTALPEEFLRGVGASESLRYFSCFVSYSHHDKIFVSRLSEGLNAIGIQCWLDDKDMKIGERIADSVSRAIKRNDKVLLCCSRACLTSSWVEDELSTAIEKERREGRDVVIPLDLDGYLFEGWTSGHAARIRERLAGKFRGWESDSARFNEQLQRLANALKTDGPRVGGNVTRERVEKDSIIKTFERAKRRLSAAKAARLQAGEMRKEAMVMGQHEEYEGFERECEKADAELADAQSEWDRAKRLYERKRGNSGKADEGG
jgi:TIR domain-containing protein/pentapeptide repeat protein